jgi:hypothetical protein
VAQVKPRPLFTSAAAAPSLPSNPRAGSLRPDGRTHASPIYWPTAATAEAHDACSYGADFGEFSGVAADVY